MLYGFVIVKASGQPLVGVLVAESDSDAGAIAEELLDDVGDSLQWIAPAEVVVRTYFGDGIAVLAEGEANAANGR